MVTINDIIDSVVERFRISRSRFTALRTNDAFVTHVRRLAVYHAYLHARIPVADIESAMPDVNIVGMLDDVTEAIARGRVDNCMSATVKAAVMEPVRRYRHESHLRAMRHCAEIRAVAREYANNNYDIEPITPIVCG